MAFVTRDSSYELLAVGELVSVKPINVQGDIPSVSEVIQWYHPSETGFAAVACSHWVCLFCCGCCLFANLQTSNPDCDGYPSQTLAAREFRFNKTYQMKFMPH